MRAVSRVNRIHALLVALLYVFFTTFGAVAHTHTSLLTGKSGSSASRLASQDLSSDATCFANGQRDCAACEWQALSVTHTVSTPVHAVEALLPIVPTYPDFSIYTVCLSRFSSRGPPSA